MLNRNLTTVSALALAAIVLTACGRPLPEPTPTGDRTYEPPAHSYPIEPPVAPPPVAEPAPAAGATTVVPPSVAYPDSPPNTFIRMAPIPNPAEDEPRTVVPPVMTRPSDVAIVPQVQTPRTTAPRVWRRAEHSMTAAPVRQPAQPRAVQADVPRYTPPVRRDVVAAPVFRAPVIAAPVVALPAVQAPAVSAPVPAVTEMTASESLVSPSAEKLKALQQATTLPATYGATLTAPEALKNKESGTVTLTLPSNLYSTIRTEASKLGIAGAAEETYLTSLLSGSGYLIEPVAAQTVRLIGSEGARFEWRVTPNGEMRSPLRANLDVSLEGEGKPQTYALAVIDQKAAIADPGSESSGFKLPGFGNIPVGLLVLLALAVGLVLLLAKIASNREEARRIQERRRNNNSLF